MYASDPALSQQSFGNQSMQRMLQAKLLQAKLTIKPPDNEHEKEADQVADSVMRMPVPAMPTSEKDDEEKRLQTKPLPGQNLHLIQRQEAETKEDEEEKPLQTKPLSGHDSLIQRQAVQEDEEKKNEDEEMPIQTKSLSGHDALIEREEVSEDEEKKKEEETPIQTKPLPGDESPSILEEAEDERRKAHYKDEEEGLIQRKTASGNPSQTVDERVLHHLGSGQPLDHGTRDLFEPRFGQDFSGVRVHSDAQSGQASKTLNAQAFTTGQDIYFGAGHYQPGTEQGQQLLAHELAHVLQQSNADGIRIGQSNQRSNLVAGAVMQRQHEKSPKPAQPLPPACATSYVRAKTFQQLIDLVRAAETRLHAAGITTAKDQIHALRGIYYGTTWSLDYTGPPGGKGEASAIRNEGFQRFTRPSESPEKTIPRDVRAILPCGLFEALKASQDVGATDRHPELDFGHLIIALDARFDPLMTKEIDYPTGIGIGSVPMGGTGTELVTWLGDLGGGTANVAIARAANKITSVSEAFNKPSDYGGTINLEGDIAGFVVASNGSTSLTAPSLPSGKGLSDALQDYLSPGAPSAIWRERAITFLKMYGGLFDATNNLTNRAALISTFAPKMITFACNYMASRVKDGHVTFDTAKRASDHVKSASEEVAEVFVDALADSAKTGGKIEAKRFPAAKPANPGACKTQIYAGGLLGGLKRIWK